MARGQERLGRLLVDMDFLSEDELESALENQKASGKRLGQLLIDDRLLTEERLVSALARHLDLSAVDPLRTPVHEKVLDLLPAELAYRLRVIPMARRREGEQETLYFATANPFDASALKKLEDHLGSGVKVSWMVAGENEMSEGLVHHYGPMEGSEEVAEPEEKSTDLTEEPPEPAAREPAAREPEAPEPEAPEPEAAEPAAPEPAAPEPEEPLEESEDFLPFAEADFAEPSPVAERPVGETLPAEFGPYMLKKRIGAGGMAEIFLAMTKGLGGFEHALVIKRMRPSLVQNEEFKKLFVGEANLSVGLRHPNIVQVFNTGEVDDISYIAMEYVRGSDLKRVLGEHRKQRKSIPENLCLHIVSEVLKGLHYCHEATGPDREPLGIVHRDVSPSNILLSLQGDIKLVDFGVAKSASSDQTAFGVLKGKFGYMAPEQLMGAKVDRRTDIFAVGIILYELLTGRALFGGDETDFDSVERMLDGEVIEPLRHYRSDVSEEIEAIVLKALANKPDDRFQTAAAFRRAIHDEQKKVEGTAVGWTEIEAFLRETFGESEETNDLPPPPKPAEYPVPEAAYEPEVSWYKATSKAAQRAGRQAKLPDGLRIAVIIVVALVVGGFMISTLTREQRGVPTHDRPPIAPMDTDHAVSETPVEPDLPVDRNTVGTPSRPPKRRASRIEIMPGMFDETAADGFGFVRANGTRMVDTASKKGKLLRELGIGQRIQRMSSIEGFELVVIPPRGPSGFVGPNQIVIEKPIGTHINQLAPTMCPQKKGATTLADCLFKSKVRLDQLHARCQSKSESPKSVIDRCKEVSQAAFDYCLRMCNDWHRNKR